MSATTYGKPGRVTDHGDGLWEIDLGFQDREGIISAYLLAAGNDLALAETGPTSTMPHLLAGIREAGFDPASIGTIVVSHIHLDHSGAAGVLLRDHLPDAVVRVHPVGAPHLIDPAKLVASATRLYTDRMDALWGEVAPVPSERVVALEDGLPFQVGGRPLTALYTAGHASHHVTLWDPARSAAFTGDVGGVRMQGTGFNLPPAPPPEVDPAAWAVSAERMAQLAPERLFLTHGGLHTDAEAHLGQLVPNLSALTALAKVRLLAGDDHDALTAAIHDWVSGQIGPVDPEIIVNLEWASPSYLAAFGLTRLLVKAGEVPDPRAG
jgi:glyoxylase-like metal-dependent hydrolase (beta-lactamase superfamily II)